MAKKKFLIFLGLGKNQIRYIKQINKKKNFIIGLDKNDKNRSLVDYYIKHSIHNPKINYIKGILKKFNVDHIMYRSSGPTILLANILEKFYGIKRVNISLAKSIYSKSFFSNFLQKNKIKFIKYKFKNNLKKDNFNELKILKPDSPLVGKKNIYIAKSFKKDDLKKCIKNSHNKKIIISDFIIGRDINSFFAVDKYKNIYFVANFEEKNTIIKNKLISNKTQIVSPVKDINSKTIIKTNEVCKRIIKKYKNFYGLISITCRITPLNEILPYEINIGLSGDNFGDTIYPKIYKKSLYKKELSMLFDNYIN